MELEAVAGPVIGGGADSDDGVAAAPGLLLYAPVAPTAELCAALGTWNNCPALW